MNKPGAIKNTGESSAKFGNCEVCGKYCSEVFTYKTKEHNLLFGHKKCLESQNELH